MGVWQHFMEALGVSSKKVTDRADHTSILGLAVTIRRCECVALRASCGLGQWRQVHDRQPLEGDLCSIVLVAGSKH